jgi:glucosamine--fructose-6-phosphate aminotransferase (isomerizing)
LGWLMIEEALASAEAVAGQEGLDKTLTQLARAIAGDAPNLALTVARGSSDHAASYFAYLTMARAGVPVVSLPMSLVTLHRAPLQVAGQLAVAVSQSGQSPDVVETMMALEAARATTVAFVNVVDSPLTRACQWLVPLGAGVERSVAATKSYICALTALARLVGHWRRDPMLLQALLRLPEQFVKVAPADGERAIKVLATAERAMVIGRGLGFAVALEAALKLKETSSIQAEAFTSAEVRHGPMSLVDAGYPVLVFALRGPEQAGLLDLARSVRARGAQVILAAPRDVTERDITLNVADEEALDPILAIHAFYLLVARVAEARGLDPDVPRHLAKVTMTR